MAEHKRIPGVTRHCSVCDTVVARLVKKPGDIFASLEPTEAWGDTSLSEYRCKDHTEEEK